MLKIHPRIPTAKFKSKFGRFVAKPTLQESGLERVGFLHLCIQFEPQSPNNQYLE